MDKLAWYLLSSGLALGLLLLPYRLWLGRLTHFRWNRSYLLGSLLLALFLPWLSLYLAPEPVPEPPAAQMEVVAERPLPELEQPLAAEEAGMPALVEVGSLPELSLVPATQEPPRHGKTALWWVYLAGLSLGLFRLLRGTLLVWGLRRGAPTEIRNGYTLVRPARLSHSFSFFGWLFLSPADAASPDRDTVLAHEEVHIHQRHSWDVILADLAGSVWWCMPWMRFFKASLRETHEYLADEAAARQCGRAAYSRMVLARISPQPSLPVQYFAQSNTTKRILMLAKKPSRRPLRWMYLMLLPVAIASSLLLSFLPGPEPELGPPAAAELDFAGDRFPAAGPYQEGLHTQVDALKARPDLCRKLLLRAARFGDDIRTILAEEGVPADFFYLMVAESHLNPEAASPIGACGMWQFMPQTATNYGMTVNAERDDRLDVVRATHAAARLLKDEKAAHGSWTAAALAYNRGGAALRKVNPDRSLEGWYEMDHARGYLYRILAVKLMMEDPASFGLEPVRGFALPLKGLKGEDVTSDYGMRHSPIEKKSKHHNGVDFRAAKGTPVYAIGDGVVSVAEHADEGHGNRVQLDHGASLGSSYSHLETIAVKAGQRVQRGDQIGTVGNSGLSLGPHLHLEIHEKGQHVHPGLYLKY